MTTGSMANGLPQAAGAAEDLTLPPPPPARPIQWRRAVRALRELLADPEQTEKAFEIFMAIGARDEERGFQKFLAHPSCQKLLRTRPLLIDALSNRSALAQLPAASFGRAYVDYLDRTGFEPDGLLRLKWELQARAERDGEPQARLDPLREWWRDRSILMHDLWHVLSGYGTDELGEAALLPFTYAQAGGRANLLLVIGVAVRGTVEARPSILRYLWQAWRRGRRAVWLPALTYEDLLALPLEEVRRLANVQPSALAHPNGIRRGDWRETNDGH